ncbi:MAG: EscU/YscU/HrcU family type III secretion system export apparatus switch protein [Holophagaceae bacterium]|nr:EscU/YscU/HrcU family type III secretion system export apparatus switch protein [Holophagaceae bacterium]
MSCRSLVGCCCPSPGSTCCWPWAQASPPAGLHLQCQALQPRIRPAEPPPRASSAFSTKALVDLVKSLAKFALLACVAYAVLEPRIPA